MHKFSIYIAISEVTCYRFIWKDISDSTVNQKTDNWILSNKVYLYKNPD